MRRLKKYTPCPRQRGNLAIILLVYGFFFALAMGVVYLVSLWTDRNLEFWLSHILEREVVVPGWMSFVLTLVTNGLCLLANIIAEIARLCI